MWSRVRVKRSMMTNSLTTMRWTASLTTLMPWITPNIYEIYLATINESEYLCESLPRPHFYQTRSAWSKDQGSNENHSPVHNLAPTATKFCVMWEGQALPQDTTFGNCRDKIVDSRAFLSWSLILGSSWSGLIKLGPGDIVVEHLSVRFLWGWKDVVHWIELICKTRPWFETDSLDTKVFAWWHIRWSA